MRIGAVFPQTEIGDDPAAIAAWARAVEDLGYQHILAFDHVIGAGLDTRPDWDGPYASEDAFHEVFVLFGYLAAITSLELVPGVLILPQRQTALAAKQAAEVDVLTGGRTRLGVGVGWNPVEFDVLGESFGNRGARIEEQVALMRALWARPTVTFDGRWHSVDNAGIKPRPVRGDIPVWFGGSAEAVLRRIGRIGDGWLPGRAPDETAAAMLDRIHRYATEAGRSPADIGCEPRLNVARVEQPGWADYLTGWRDLGATHVTVNTMGVGLPDWAAHVEVLREVKAVSDKTNGLGSPA